ncbi:DUF4399 domain-containing protein [Bacteroidia bacterium]|nr:DUF4399 domain-containing protein [Bacteroidia bacterium]
MKRSTLIFGTILSLFFAACNSGSTESIEKADDAAETTEENQSAEINTEREIGDNQNVFFPNLEDGQEIELPFVIEFGVEGMEVEPAGVVVENKGHHHLLVDSDPIPSGLMVPANETNVHYGKGQLFDSLQLSKFPTLTPGKHTLTLQFADGIHSSYGPKMSKTINIIVK